VEDFDAEVEELDVVELEDVDGDVGVIAEGEVVVFGRPVVRELDQHIPSFYITPVLTKTLLDDRKKSWLAFIG
jgi:hypothetical protein